MLFKVLYRVKSGEGADGSGSLNGGGSAYVVSEVSSGMVLSVGYGVLLLYLLSLLLCIERCEWDGSDPLSLGWRGSAGVDASKVM